MNTCKDNDGYVDGYASGYEFLTSNQYMKHPSEPGGYVPGGPCNLHFRYINKLGNPVEHPTDDINPAWTTQQNYIHNWRIGWKAGINQYVKDNNLDFPDVN